MAAMTGPTTARDAEIDLLRPWFPLIKRLRQQAKTKTGNAHAILTVKVLVNEHGEPIQWTTPERVQLEPRAGGDSLEALMKHLGG
jgi:hypothetical protein